MPYVDFPENLKGQKARKQFWLSDDGITLITGWRRQGVPVTKIAKDYVGVSNTAWFGWYKESDKLRKAVANSKELANMTVEEALYKRAVGYNYVEETFELVEGELIKTKEVHKHVSPDVKAIMHWLFNKLPSQWRAIQEPLESTQYAETVRNILVAMKEVAATGDSKVIEAKEEQDAE